MLGELKDVRERAQGLRAGLGGCCEGGAHGRGAPARHLGETDTGPLGGVGAWRVAREERALGLK